MFGSTSLIAQMRNFTFKIWKNGDGGGGGGIKLTFL